MDSIAAGTPDCGPSAIGLIGRTPANVRGRRRNTTSFDPSLVHEEREPRAGKMLTAYKSPAVNDGASRLALQRFRPAGSEPL